MARLVESKRRVSTAAATQVTYQQPQHVHSACCPSFVVSTRLSHHLPTRLCVCNAVWREDVLPSEKAHSIACRVGVWSQNLKVNAALPSSACVRCSDTTAACNCSNNGSCAAGGTTHSSSSCCARASGSSSSPPSPPSSACSRAAGGCDRCAAVAHADWWST